MPSRLKEINISYENEDCAIGTKLPVDLVDNNDPNFTMVVKDGQSIPCPKRKPAGSNIIPSGNILTVKFSGCNGCNAYKPKE